MIAVGALLGLPLALVAALVVVLAGYPDWARTIWQLATILAGVGVGMAASYSVIAYAVWHGTQVGFEDTEPIPGYAFFLARPVIVATVALLSIAAGLTAVFTLGAGESLF